MVVFVIEIVLFAFLFFLGGEFNDAYGIGS